MLTQDGTRTHLVHKEYHLPLPVKAAVHVFRHALVCVDAAGLAVPAEDLAGYISAGIAVEGFDNTAGQNGVVSGTSLGSARFIHVDTEGEWELQTDGATPKALQLAYAVDDETVSAEATENSVVVGRFTRPGHAAGWWFVNISMR